MKTDLVSSVAPAPQEAAAGEKTSRSRGGEAFALLLQEIFSARLSPPVESVRGIVAAQPEAAAGKAEGTGEPGETLYPEEMLFPLPEAVQSLPAAPEDNGQTLTGNEEGQKRALLNRLLEELGQKGKSLLILTPWLQSALSSGQEMSGSGSSAEMGLPLKSDELFLLEQKLISGEIPLLDEKGFLTPEAGQVLSSYFREEGAVEKLKLFFPEIEGKGVSASPLQIAGSTEKSFWENLTLAAGKESLTSQPFFTEEKEFTTFQAASIHEEESAIFRPASAVSGSNSVFLSEGLSAEGKQFSGVSVKQMDFKDSELIAYSSSQAEAAGEKPQQPPSFLDRLEGFLRSFLSGEKAASGGTVSAEGLSEDGLPDSVSGEGEPLGKPGSGGEFALSSGNRLEEPPAIQQAPSRFNSLPPREIISQVVDKLSLLTRPGEQELRMKLQPEFLGEILIRMKRVKGVLTAEIITQNIAVKELLEGQMDILRQRFQQMNMNVEEFRVYLNSERNGGNGGEARKHYSDGDGSYAAKGSYGNNTDPDFNGYEENGRVNYLA